MSLALDFLLHMGPAFDLLLYMDPTAFYTHRPLAFIWPSWVFTFEPAISDTWALDQFLLFLPPNWHHIADNLASDSLALSLGLWTIP